MTEEQVKLQYRILHQVLKMASNGLNAGAIRKILNAQPGAAPVTKSDVNKILYRDMKDGHVSGEKAEDGSNAPIWHLCPELKNEPSVEALQKTEDTEEEADQEAMMAEMTEV